MGWHTGVLCVYHNSEKFRICREKLERNGKWGGNSVEKYSVLMAVYYREKPEYLYAAIESMLAQTVMPDEFVLVCDGPLTDALNAVIAEFCAFHPELFRIVRLERNMGLGTALNAGLRQCRNELVARMDSDDLSVPDRMEKQLEAMGQDPGISVLGGQIGEFYEDPKNVLSYRIVPTEEANIREFLKCRSPMNHTTVVLRRSHILQAGSYQAISGFEDYTLWIRLIANGYHMKNIQDVCCRVRADGGMYARRGGVRYFRNTLKMERLLLEEKIISPQQFRKNVAVRFVGTMMLPACVRRIVFQTFLRTKGKTTAEERRLQRRCRVQMSPLKGRGIVYRREIAGQPYIKQ